MAEYNIPGVYSTLDASAAVKSLSPNNNVIGIVATATTGDVNVAYAPISFNDAKEKYGANSNVVKLMEIATKNGGNSFIVVRVEADEVEGTKDYTSALAILAKEEAVDIVIIDSTDNADKTLLKEHLVLTSNNRKERIAVTGFAKGDNTTTAISSNIYNSGRMYSPFPNGLDIDGNEVEGIYTAAALAGAFAAETDPSMPMTNVELVGFYGLADKLDDDEMDALIVAGIIPLSAENGSITIVRAISTYTKDAEGNPDITWQELTTTRISDYIFKDLRTTLRRNYARARQSKATRDSIKSDIITKLLEYQTVEYIENVNTEADVDIKINPTNPLRNDVSFNYNVTGPLNVIHLTGHLSI